MTTLSQVMVEEVKKITNLQAERSSSLTRPTVSTTNSQELHTFKNMQIKYV